jgi:DNA-binding beta-propeller fold protein YncE
MRGFAKNGPWAVWRALWVTAALAGCVDRTPPCATGTHLCDGACLDLSQDAQNCGGCGVSCQAGNLCQEGVCACPSGTGLCDGSCVSLQASAKHCGACGHACGPAQVCQQGICQSSCTDGLTECAGGCVRKETDPLNCGACGNVCAPGKGCRGQTCAFEVFAACFDNGQVVGLSSSGGKGVASSVGSGPQRLAVSGGGLWVADGLDQKMRRLHLATLSESGGQVAVGKSPQAILVEGGYLFVVSSLSNALQIFRATGEDLSPVGSVSFGANAAPQGVVRNFNQLYVPLYGGLGSGAAVGQKVAVVDIQDPTKPSVVGSYDLMHLDLQPFPGQSPLPRPYDIVQWGDSLYVALNNLAADDSGMLVPGGPGMVARIELKTAKVTALSLGSDVCLNAVSLAVTPQGLVVSCAGVSDFSQWPLVKTEKTGAVLISPTGARLGSWSLSCPPADPDCPTPLAGKVTASGSRVYLADQTAGRVFILDSSTGTLEERRGFAKEAPVVACAVDPARGYSSVMDLVALP